MRDEVYEGADPNLGSFQTANSIVNTDTSQFFLKM